MTGGDRRVGPARWSPLGDTVLDPGDVRERAEEELAPATPSMTCRLVTGGRVVILTPFTGAVVLGRAGDCEVVFDELVVSGRHARVAHVGGGWSIEDLGSRNGTYVNGVAVPATDGSSILLRDGDVVRLGGHGPECRFSCRPTDVTVPPRSGSW